MKSSEFAFKINWPLVQDIKDLQDLHDLQDLQDLHNLQVGPSRPTRPTISIRPTNYELIEFGFANLNHSMVTLKKNMKTRK